MSRVRPFANGVGFGMWVGWEAVVLKKVLCFAKVLYRDIDSKCRVKWEPFSLDTLIERP